MMNWTMIPRLATGLGNFQETTITVLERSTATLSPSASGAAQQEKMEEEEEGEVKEEEMEEEEEEEVKEGVENDEEEKEMEK